MRVLLLLFAALFAGSAAAQEIVTLQTRGNVTQSFYIPAMKAKPAAAALLFAGGGGHVRLRTEEGQIAFGRGNFLPRSRNEFVRNQILPVLVDAPTDQQGEGGISDEFRRSAEHALDVRAVLAELAKRHPGLPVFLVGTSRSTISIVNLAAALHGEIAGVVLSSSLFFGPRGPGRAPRPPVLLSFNWASLRVPLLLVHHADDGCGATPYDEAVRLSRRYAFPLITVKGGLPPKSGPCEPLSEHGFYGKEAETVAAIAGWMLGKPFAKDIQ